MNLQVVSLFRNVGQLGIARYRARLAGLDFPLERLRVTCVEGDSNDDTLQALQAWAANDPRVEVIKHDLGRPYYGSCVHPERFFILGTCADVGLQAVVERGWADKVLWLESDLRLTSIHALLMCSHRMHVVAPYVWFRRCDGGLQFYDIWAFRTLDGQMFPPCGPTWYDMCMPSSPFEVQSAGSCLLFDMQALRDGARFTTREAIVSFCKELRKRRYVIFVNPEAAAFHPTPPGAR